MERGNSSIHGRGQHIYIVTTFDTYIASLLLYHVCTSWPQPMPLRYAIKFDAQAYEDIYNLINQALAAKAFFAAAANRACRQRTPRDFLLQTHRLHEIVYPALSHKHKGSC